MFSSHAKHRFKLTVILVIVLLLISTFYFVVSINNVDATTINGLGKGMKVYGIWLVSVFNNVKAVTGDVIGMDWRATNGTIGESNSSSINLFDSGKNAGEVVVNTTANAVNKIKPKANTPKPITSYK